MHGSHFLKWALGVCLLGLGLSTGWAQQTVATSGGNATGTGGSAAYSVGQLVYSTQTDTAGTVAQGVQHPYEILTVGIVNPNWNFSLNAFPNPTSDYLSLEIDKLQATELAYQLVDVKGIILKKGIILDNRTKIDVKDLPVATYFVRISEKTTLLHTFKILKH